MRSRIFLVALILIVLPLLAKPRPAEAWGRQGHLTICDLAYRNFTPTTRNVVRQLLGPREGGILVRGRGKMADRRYTAFNVGCLEEDSPPRRHPGDHFINLAHDVGAIDGAACPRNGDAS